MWKTIKNYNNYEISTEGLIRNRTTGKILTAKKNSTGIYLVNLYQNKKSKSFTVHSLVVETFLEPVDGCKRIQHINGYKCDNNLNNLKYVSNSEIIKASKVKNKLVLIEKIIIVENLTNNLEIMFD